MISKKYSISHHPSALSIFYRVTDCVVILAALYLAVHVRGIDLNKDYLTAGFLGCLLFILVAGILDLYRSWRGVSLWHEFRAMAACWGIAALGLLFTAFAAKETATYSRVAIGGWFLAAPFLLAFYRGFVRQSLRLCRRRGIGTRKAAIAGAGMLGQRLASFLSKSTWIGYDVVAFYDDSQKPEKQNSECHITGTMEDLVRDAREQKFESVFIALPMRAEERIRQLIDALGDTSVSVYFAPDFFVFDLVQSREMILGGIPVISVFESPFSGTLTRWVKRTEDLVLASFALIILALPLAAIAVGVRLSSPGPILFRQRRHGLDGKEIEVWKFRTMTCCEDGKNAFVQAKENDYRITPFGRFLRKTSLDELPQFINVLQGRMSVVGPRPHAVAHNEQFRKLIPSYMRRHKVRPGITGLAQINGWRGETDTLEKMQKRVEYDIEYLRSWSPWLDMKIIFMTVVCIFKGEGAY